MEKCFSCGAEASAGARFCSQCGVALPTGQRAASASAERKQVSVLFSDLTGYTALSERLDPEETREIMARIFRSAAAVVARYGGRIEKFIGDALMAIFGVPQAREDDPARAVRAALELHRVVAEIAPEVEARAGARISLHSGISTGLVVTGDFRGESGSAGPLGSTINLAARLMEMAPPGEIWLEPVTRGLVASAFELEELGPREVKGKAQPVGVARVLGLAREPAGSQARGPAGGFVGRQEELDILLGAVERLRDGRGEVIALCGDAGTGKTRLLAELRERLGDGVRWLEGRAHPHTENIPYFPMIDLLNRAWHIAESDDPASVRAKLEAGVAGVVGSSESVLPVVARLYHFEPPGTPGISSEAYPTKLLEAVRQLLASIAARGPTAICLHDLQWADASTVTLLRGLIREFGVPVLFVVSHRPGFELGEAARRVELAELSGPEIRELLAALLEGVPPAEEFARRVEERCGGNPFYVQELVRSLIETGALVPADAGWRLTQPLQEIEVPSSIRGVIAARIDRLGERERRVLREAAAVGRQFLYGMLEQLSLDGADLQASLAALEAADLIRSRRRGAELEYEFTHSLTQEIAYDGLLKAERLKLHERIALAMEGQLGDRLPEFVETLAWHFLRGGVVEKAVHYAVGAGRKCVGRFALDEATTHFGNAHRLLTGRERTPAEDRELIGLLVEWSLVYLYHGHFGDLRALLEAHEELAGRVGDAELQGLFLGWLGYALYQQDELAPALEKLEHACLLAESCGSQRLVACAHTWKALALWSLGRLAEAIRAGEVGRALAPRFPDGGDYLYCESLLAVGFASATLGDLERGRRMGRDLIDFAEQRGNSRAAVIGHVCLAHCEICVNDFDRAIEAAEAARALAREPHQRALALAYLALAYAAATRFEKSRAAVDELLAHTTPRTARMLATNARAAGALTALGEGRLSHGMRALLQLRDEVARRRSIHDEVWLNLVIGIVYARIARAEVPVALGSLLRNPGFVLRHALPARRKARAWLDRALRDLERSEIKFYEGIGHLELAALLARRDRGAARAHLERALPVLERQGAEAALCRARALEAAWR